MYKVITSGTAYKLNELVNIEIKNGWTPIGSHQVVVTRIQNRFRGTTHYDSLYEIEYSQTLIFNEKIKKFNQK